MNNDEFKAKALQVLVLADQLEVLMGGELDTYTGPGSLELFEVVRRCSIDFDGNPWADYCARVIDADSESDCDFRSAFGATESESIDNLCKTLQAAAKSHEEHLIYDGEKFDTTWVRVALP